MVDCPSICRVFYTGTQALNYPGLPTGPHRVCSIHTKPLSETRSCQAYLFRYLCKVSNSSVANPWIQQLGILQLSTNIKRLPNIGSLGFWVSQLQIGHFSGEERLLFLKYVFILFTFKAPCFHLLVGLIKVVIFLKLAWKNKRVLKGGTSWDFLKFHQFWHIHFNRPLLEPSQRQSELSEAAQAVNTGTHGLVCTTSSPPTKGTECATIFSPLDKGTESEGCPSWHKKNVCQHKLRLKSTTNSKFLTWP